MLNAAERMRALGEAPSETGAPTSIFGSAMGLAQSIQAEERYRIGFYPVICPEMPEVAMGLAACLGYLLEQYQDTRVYRCFARIDSADENAEITAADYQFTAADWTFDGLADNVIVDGRFQHDAQGCELRLGIDLSLAQGDLEDDLIVRQFPTLAAAVAALPAIAEDIHSHIAGGFNTNAIIDFEPPDAGSAAMESLLEAVFGWNLDVYLYLWEVEWDAAEVVEQFLEALDQCKRAPSQFAYWRLGMMSRQVMQPGIAELGESLAPQIGRAFDGSDLAAPGAAAAALGLSRLGMAQRASALLQPYLRPEAAAAVWDAMIQIHLDSGKFDDALETAQLGLEAGVQHPALYWRYAQLLMAAEVHNWQVDDVLLLEPDDYAEEQHITVEIANALKLYVAGRPDDLSALQLALTYMIDAADDDVWTYFESLIQSDEDGIFSGDIVDRLVDLEDRERGYEILESQLDANSYAYVYLAQLALADADTGRARAMIDACRAALVEIDENLELELQRVNVLASLPDFEERYAEIKVVLGANRLVSESQVDMLERAVELAPKLVDVQLLLAACYRSWRDDDSALEVLREAEQNAGPDPQIDLGVARILWARSRGKEAVAKLNAALERFPNDVGLLGLMATYLIENSQYEDAREYIALAETISPSHRAVWQVRRLIAQKMAE